MDTILDIIQRKYSLSDFIGYLRQWVKDRVRLNTALAEKWTQFKFSLISWWKYFFSRWFQSFSGILDDIISYIEILHTWEGPVYLEGSEDKTPWNVNHHHISKAGNYHDIHHLGNNLRAYWRASKVRLVEYLKYVDVEGLDIQNPVQWIVSFWVCWITWCNFWSRHAASL